MFLPSTFASTSRHLATSTLLPRSLINLPSKRFISSTRSLRKDEDGNPFSHPSPPPLPRAEQLEFERLVKEKANSLQFNAVKEGDELHPNYRAKPKADFEGDINPETGEVGGPKKEPLKWEREWSYGGRATDF